MIHVTPPPQCKARRRPTLLERTRYYLLGRVHGFDPDQECRCNRYAGHEKFDYPHEDVTGFIWTGER